MPVVGSKRVIACFRQQDPLKGRSPGTILVSRLPAHCWRFWTSVGKRVWAPSFSGCAGSIVIMKNDIKKRTVHAYGVSNIVVDKAKLPESVHEVADPRTCGAHHLCQGLLTEPRD